MLSHIVKNGGLFLSHRDTLQALCHCSVNALGSDSSGLLKSLQLLLTDIIFYNAVLLFPLALLEFLLFSLVPRTIMSTP